MCWDYYGAGSNCSIYDAMSLKRTDKTDAPLDKMTVMTVFTNLCVCQYVCTHVYMYVCMHVRKYACLYVCMYVCIESYSPTPTRNVKDYHEA